MEYKIDFKSNKTAACGGGLLGGREHRGHRERENPSKFLHRPRVGAQTTATCLGPGCAPSSPGHSKKERQRLGWLSGIKLNEV